MIITRAISIIFISVTLLFVVFAGIVNYEHVKQVQKEAEELKSQPSDEFKEMLEKLDSPNEDGTTGWPAQAPNPSVGPPAHEYRIDSVRKTNRIVTVSLMDTTKPGISYTFHECQYCHKPYLAIDNPDGSKTFVFKDHVFL